MVLSKGRVKDHSTQHTRTNLNTYYSYIKGTWTYANGDQYVGDWANGHKHGYGIWTLKNGDRYEGPFFNDARNGIGGKYFFATGDLYIGDYVDNIKEGNGEYIAKVTTPCRDVATSGKYRYFEGDHYIGQYRKNNRHGIGKQWSKNGNIYEGEWVDHYMNGQGTLTLADGECITFDGNYYYGSIAGLWEGDKLIKILPKVEISVNKEVVSTAAPNESLVAAAIVNNRAAAMTEPAFAGAGKSAGLEVWHFEALKPVKVNDVST